eukprot:3242197-Heterocapsa_arctica.AAC.1
MCLSGSLASNANEEHANREEGRSAVRLCREPEAGPEGDGYQNACASQTHCPVPALMLWSKCAR